MWCAQIVRAAHVNHVSRPHHAGGVVLFSWSWWEGALVIWLEAVRVEEEFQCDATLSWWMDSFTKPRFKGSGMTQLSPDPREKGNICGLTWRGRREYVTVRMVSWARLTKHCSMDLCQSGPTYLHKRAHKCAKSQQLKMSIKHKITLKILRVFHDEAKLL